MVMDPGDLGCVKEKQGKVRRLRGNDTQGIFREGFLFMSIQFSSQMFIEGLLCVSTKEIAGTHPWDNAQGEAFGAVSQLRQRAVALTSLAEQPLTNYITSLREPVFLFGKEG
jgi:hypothetical protein